MHLAIWLAILATLPAVLATGFYQWNYPQSLNVLDTSAGIGEPLGGFSVIGTSSNAIRAYLHFDLHIYMPGGCGGGAVTETLHGLGSWAYDYNLQGTIGNINDCLSKMQYAIDSVASSNTYSFSLFASDQDSYFYTATGNYYRLDYFPSVLSGSWDTWRARQNEFRWLGGLDAAATSYVGFMMKLTEGDSYGLLQSLAAFGPTYGSQWYGAIYNYGTTNIDYNCAATNQLNFWTPSCGTGVYDAQCGSYWQFWRSGDPNLLTSYPCIFLNWNSGLNRYEMNNDLCSNAYRAFLQYGSKEQLPIDGPLIGTNGTITQNQWGGTGNWCGKNYVPTYRSLPSDWCDVWMVTTRADSDAPAVPHDGDPVTNSYSMVLSLANSWYSTTNPESYVSWTYTVGATTMVQRCPSTGWDRSAWISCTVSIVTGSYDFFGTLVNRGGNQTVTSRQQDTMSVYVSPEVNTPPTSCTVAYSSTVSSFNTNCSQTNGQGTAVVNLLVTYKDTDVDGSGNHDQVWKSLTLTSPSGRQVSVYSGLKRDAYVTTSGSYDHSYETVSATLTEPGTWTMSVIVADNYDGDATFGSQRCTASGSFTIGGVTFAAMSGVDVPGYGPATSVSMSDSGTIRPIVDGTYRSTVDFWFTLNPTTDQFGCQMASWTWQITYPDTTQTRAWNAGAYGTVSGISNNTVYLYGMDCESTTYYILKAHRVTKFGTTYDSSYTILVGPQLSSGPAGSTPNPITVTITHDGIPGPNYTMVNLTTSRYDPNGYPLNYSWTLGGSVLSTTSSLNVSQYIGVSTYKLVTTDSTGISKTDQIVVTVNPEPNAYPVILSPSVITAQVPHDCIQKPTTTWVLVNSSIFDPDGDPWTVTWTINGVLLPTTSQQMIYNFTGQPGVYYFQINATDSYSALTSKTILVAIYPVSNYAPYPMLDVARQIQIPHQFANNTLTYRLVAGKIAPQSTWNVTDAFGAAVVTNKVLTGWVMYLPNGFYNFTLVVNSSNNQAGTTLTNYTDYTHKWTFTGVNILSTDLVVVVPHVGNYFYGTLWQDGLVDGTYNVSAAFTHPVTRSTDPENDPLTYYWQLLTQPSGSPAFASNTSTSEDWDMTVVPGIYTFQMNVTDCYNYSSAAQITLQVLPRQNLPPVPITAQPTITVHIPHDYNLKTNTTWVFYDGRGIYDPDDDPFTFWWTFSDGTTYYTPTVNLTLGIGQYVMTLTTQDIYNASAQAFIPTTVLPVLNNPPMFIAAETYIEVTIPHDGTPLTNTTTVSVNVTGSYDPDVDPFTTTMAISGVGQINATQGVFNLSAGLYTVVVTLTDMYGAVTTGYVLVRVNPEPNQAPVANLPTIQQATIPHDGNPATNTYAFTVSTLGVMDPDGDNITMTWYQDLFSSTTSELLISQIYVGNPLNLILASGVYHYELKASDPYGAYDQRQFLVAIYPEPNLAPVPMLTAAQSIALPTSSNTTGQITYLMRGALANPIVTWIATNLANGNVTTWSPAPGASYYFLPDGFYGLSLTIDRSGTQSLTPGAVVGNWTHLWTFTNVSVTDLTVLSQMPYVGEKLIDPLWATILVDGNYNVTANYTTTYSRSYDPDGDPITFQWMQVYPTTAVLATTQDVSVTVGVGTYQYQLKVCDSYQFCSRALTQLTVTPQMTTGPVALAQSTITVRVNFTHGDPSFRATVLLNASSSYTPTGGALTINWVFDGKIMATGAVAYVNFTVGLHSGYVLAIDSHGAQSTSPVSVNVIEGPNLPPIAIAASSLIIQRVPHDGNPLTFYSLFTLDGTPSYDQNGDAITYQWWEGPMLRSTLAQPVLSRPPGTYEFTLIVSDPWGLTAQTEVFVQVLPELNAPPQGSIPSTISATVPHDHNPATNTAPVLLDGSNITDPDGDALTFQWTRLGILVATTQTATANLVPGIHQIHMIVTDPYSASLELITLVSVAPEPNQPPVAAPVLLEIDAVTVVNGVIMSVNVSMDGSLSDDPDDGPAYLTYQWVNAQTGKIIGNQVDAYQIIETDGNLEQHASFVLTVTDPYGASNNATLNVASLNPHKPAPLPTFPDITVRVPHTGNPSITTANFTIDGTDAVQKAAYNRTSPIVVQKWVAYIGNQQDFDPSQLRQTLARPPGEYHFILMVQDSAGITSLTTQKVFVLPLENEPPFVGFVQVPTPFHAVSYSNSTSNTATGDVPLVISTAGDPDGDNITITVESVQRTTGLHTIHCVFGMNPANASALPLTCIIQLPIGGFDVTVTAMDPYSATDSQEQLVVVVGNRTQPPVVGGVSQSYLIPASFRSVVIGMPVPSYADPLGLPLMLSWQAADSNVVVSQNGSTVAQFVARAGKTYDFTVFATSIIGTTGSNNTEIVVSTDPQPYALSVSVATQTFIQVGYSQTMQFANASACVNQPALYPPALTNVLRITSAVMCTVDTPDGGCTDSAADVLVTPQWLATTEAGVECAALEFRVQPLRTSDGLVQLEVNVEADWVDTVSGATTTEIMPIVGYFNATGCPSGQAFSSTTKTCRSVNSGTVDTVLLMAQFFVSGVLSTGVITFLLNIVFL